MFARILLGLALSAFLVVAHPGWARDTTATLLQSMAAGNTAFALDLYARFPDKDDNLVFSPYSLTTALAMTASGARGETQRQMADALRFPAEPDRILPLFAILQSQMTSHLKPGKADLAVANSLWPSSIESFRPEYLALLQTTFSAEVRAVDYLHATEQARQTINDWVMKKTNDKIKDLIPPDGVKPTTTLVLTNAVYFKADWKFPFEVGRTKDGSFTLPSGGQTSAPMMTQTREFAYGETTEMQIVELPYASDGLSMVILLPRQSDGLAALETSLTPQTLDSLTHALAPRRVDLSVPRFKLEWTAKDLRTLFQDMGMKDAFGGIADFSGMSSDPIGGISDVLHKAFIEVNETGTEAAAASAVVIGRSASLLTPVSPVVFRADHPFLFLLRERSTGYILFLGRVANPAAEG